MTKRELINKAKEAKAFAHVPYSGFSVGAALLTKSGKVYTGCNIENSSFGATICAERIALFKAISEGVTEFESMAVVSSANDVTYPCGICRQVLSDHMYDGKLYFENKDGEIIDSSVKEVLPFKFNNEIPNKK